MKKTKAQQMFEGIILAHDTRKNRVKELEARLLREVKTSREIYVKYKEAVEIIKSLLTYVSYEDEKDPAFKRSERARRFVYPAEYRRAK